MRPLQISAETAQKLAESLNLPLEQIMHMPQHILLAKMAELQKRTNHSLHSHTCLPVSG
ncbi:YycC family protein [Bacillus sp. 3A_MP1]